MAYHFCSEYILYLFFIFFIYLYVFIYSDLYYQSDVWNKIIKSTALCKASYLVL